MASVLIKRISWLWHGNANVRYNLVLIGKQYLNTVKFYLKDFVVGGKSY